MAKSASLKRRRKKRRSSAGLPRGFAMGIVLLVTTAVIAWKFRAVLDHEDTTALPHDERVLIPAPKPEPKPEPPAPAPSPEERFEFYDMLPDAEVEVPQQSQSTSKGGPPVISMPGTYVVQAGAFPNFAEADKVKARLALLGIVSEIQTAESNGRRFHRVRIGPISDLDELNRMRARLSRNGIESLVIPVGE